MKYKFLLIFSRIFFNAARSLLFFPLPFIKIAPTHVVVCLPLNTWKKKKTREERRLEKAPVHVSRDHCVLVCNTEEWIQLSYQLSQYLLNVSHFLPSCFASVLCQANSAIKIDWNGVTQSRYLSLLTTMNISLFKRWRTFIPKEEQMMNDVVASFCLFFPSLCRVETIGFDLHGSAHAMKNDECAEHTDAGFDDIRCMKDWTELFKRHKSFLATR